MTISIVDRVNASETGDEVHSLSDHEPEHVVSAASNTGTPVTSE